MNSDVGQLLGMLREAKLTWLAEEIVLALEERKHQSEATGGGELRSQQDLPFEAPNEELALAIQIVRDLFVAAPQMHEEAIFFLSEKGGLLHKPVKILALDPTLSEVGELFDYQAVEASRRLDGLLRDAWPYGPEDYDKRFVYEF